ncbi:MAG: glucuronate isomerase [Flammeovirgaceae bacterium]|nr:glucuronate isomerase [Flammeovirgaceae bacterium]
MSKPISFLGEDFLLHTDSACELYHDYASTCAIIDYHNHLSPKDIAENRKFENLTAIWLEGDHYKWRAMRANGVNERFITGNAEPKEKFLAWAKTVPATLRNPLYHWTHLELKRYFGVDELLNEKSAPEIYKHCNSKLQQKDFKVQSLLTGMKVKVVCSTDDPTDSLNHHKAMTSQSTDLKMLPTFRPDKAYASGHVENYNNYLDSLSEVSGVKIELFGDLIAALKNRIDYFDSHGCKAADHGLECIGYDVNGWEKGELIFKKIRTGNPLTGEEQQILQGAALIELSKLYHEKNWVQQFHIGAIRNNNSRLLDSLGPDTGFDSVGDFSQSRNLSSFLNKLDQTNQLAKTILYNLNPADNEVFATMTANFCDGSIPGKIQWGSAWWFLDQKDGMEKQMNTLSNMGLLARFVGMVTDSRSFLSFPRHEYFRRVLCNLLGNDIAKGELPNDLKLIGTMVQDICYNNVKNYFEFE